MEDEHNESEPPEVVPQKLSTGGRFLLAFLVLIVIGYIYADVTDDRRAEEERIERLRDEFIADNPTLFTSQAPQQQRYAVRYSTSGNIGLVTMRMPDGIEQTDNGGPWVFEAQPGEFLSVSIQNDNDFGAVTCRIEVNSEVIAENTSDAAYGIASCSGQVPR